VANADDTFDPNDLESIDALLDEAELEAVSDEPKAAESSDLEGIDVLLDEAELEAVSDEPSSEESNDLEGIDALLDDAELDAVSNSTEDVPDVLDDLEESLVSETSDETDDLLDSLDDLVADTEPEVVGVSEPQPEPEIEKTVADVITAPTKEAEVAKASAVDDTDDFLEKRASARGLKKTNLTADDMDSIKKLIIIFGSVLSVLVLIGIGIGVWSALAASSAGMDEETVTLIESIKVSTEHNGSAIQVAEDSTKSVEKKIDALNFQLEQLANDIAEIGAGKVAKNEVLDPLGLGGNHSVNKHPAPIAEIKPVVKTSVNTTDPDLVKKVTSVNSKLIKAQRRIDEVNGRIKKMQKQYASILVSVKTVEKQVLLEQAKEAEKLQKAKEASQANRYKYSSPDSGFYDQSVTDSYP